MRQIQNKKTEARKVSVWKIHERSRIEHLSNSALLHDTLGRGDYVDANDEEFFTYDCLSEELEKRLRSIGFLPRL